MVILYLPFLSDLLTVPVMVAVPPLPLLKVRPPGSLPDFSFSAGAGAPDDFIVKLAFLPRLNVTWPADVILAACPFRTVIETCCPTVPSTLVARKISFALLTVLVGVPENFPVAENFRPVGSGSAAE